MTPVRCSRNVKGWLEDKYQVILANSGAMAIKYLSTNRPDLVLLDYEMPIVDGKQVLGMIRSESEFSDIPVIFLTSKGDKESVMQVMDLKPDGYLLKTMPPEQIKQSIDTFFQRKRHTAILLFDELYNTKNECLELVFVCTDFYSGCYELAIADNSASILGSSSAILSSVNWQVPTFL